MSVLQCNFFSKCLGNFIDVTVYIPSMHNGDTIGKSLAEIYHPGERFRTIYLLHGMLDDHSCWMRWSRVEEYAEQHRIALVMPSGQNSFYVNNAHGLNYYDFIHEELILWAESTLPLLSGPKDRYIAGLSMGGYGAIRHGLSTPCQYAAVGAFSGALDIVDLGRMTRACGYGDLIPYENIFGGEDAISGTDNDLYLLMKKCKEGSDELPPVYIGCGTEDPVVYSAQPPFQQALKDLGYPVTYFEMPGVHEWNVWDTCIKQFIEMIDKQD